MNKLKVAITLTAAGGALGLALSGCGSTDVKSEQTSETTPPAAVDVPETKPADVATAALTAYCSTDREQEAWKDGLEPYLSPRGRSVYANTDVSRIDDCTVKDPAGDPEADGNLRQYVTITTDAGEWLVTVARDTETDPWRVDAFTPPPEPGGTQPPHTDGSQPDF